MNTASVWAWLRQPSTISGLGTLLGGAAGLLAYGTHAADTSSALAIAAGVKAAVSVGIPDNSAVQTPMMKLVGDAVSAMVAKNLPAAMPLLVSDGAALAAAIAAAPPPAPPAAVVIPAAAPAA